MSVVGWREEDFFFHIFFIIINYYVISSDAHTFDARQTLHAGMPSFDCSAT